MYCHRCQEDFEEADLHPIRIPVINENGRDLRDVLVCSACHVEVKAENQKIYDSNNQIQDFLGIIDLKKDPEAFVAMNADFVLYMNEESDLVYPLCPHRVASVVPDSLEAWCHTQTPSEFNEAVLQHMVDAIGRE